MEHNNTYIFPKDVVHVNVYVKKNLPVKRIRIFSVSDAQTDTHCGEVTASYPASNVYPGYRKERYSLKEFLHPLPGGRHQNEVYSLEKNSYHILAMYVPGTV
jgi:hypothetical protein